MKKLLAALLLIALPVQAQLLSFTAPASPTLGTLASQNADAVAITGGTISGLTSLGVNATTATVASMTGSNVNDAIFQIQATNSASQASFLALNDRSGFGNYGGFYAEGSARSSTMFGQTRADKVLMIADGASNTGLLVGTLSNQAVTVGSNATARLQILGAGRILSGVTIPADDGSTGWQHSGSMTVSGSFSVGTAMQASGAIVRVIMLNLNNFSRMYGVSGGHITLLNNAENDFGRLQFGGTTSSFPALKRNGAILDVRLADDSGYATLGALSYRIGTTTVIDSAAALTNISGLQFTGNARRITGDFSNGTLTNRTMFQDSGSGGTIVSTIPSATGSSSGFSAFTTTDMSNYSRLLFFIDSAASALIFRSANAGTGALQPMEFQMGTTAYGKLFNAGRWFFGASPTDDGSTTATVGGTAKVTGTITLGSTLVTSDATVIHSGSATTQGVRIAANGIVSVNRSGGNQSLFEAYADAKLGARISSGSSGGTAPYLAFANPTVGTVDVALSRTAGSTIGVGNGTAGDASGTLHAANLRFGTHSAIGAETITGYITITDAGGTTRKLAVVSP